MATITASSIFRKSSTNEAVLVTAPHISDESENNMAVIEPETYQDVDVSAAANNPLRRFLESSFGITKQKSTEEQEMEEFMTSSEAPVQINSPIHQRESVESYDICREYSYSGDDDDDDDNEINKHYFNSGTNNTAAPSSDVTYNVATYVLGKTYHPIHDYNSRRNDESSLFWFTYRCDFPCIEPYGITSDAGWGCMLRALQMMCGQALRLHYKSRDWRPPVQQQQRRQDPFLRSVLTWFADFPSSTESIYSLHNMVAAGLAKYDKLPGEWYGPGTACYVLRDLVEMHEKKQRNEHRRMFRVHVAAGGTVYRDAIEDTMVKEAKTWLETEKQKKAQELPPPLHPLDVAWEEELLDPLSAIPGTESTRTDLAWDTALLLLIPLRLGLKSFNAEYVEAVAHTFSLPQSVGVLGGRPRGARWFYGALSDGSKIFGLDPHTVQTAPKRRNARVNGKPSSVVELSDEYMRSVHTTYPEVFSLTKMDPSIALGFYCRDRADLESVFSSLRQWNEAHPNSGELFTVANRMPNYTGNISSSAIDNMMDSIMDDEGDDNASEEDEYIMI
jgi:cysteine protease ATG4